MSRRSEGTSPPRAGRRPHGDTDREILRLAVPAFLALVAEPLFLLTDAAIVGHLGTAELAGLGIAATVLQTVVGLCVFLAYGTTASVARHLGAGDLRAGLALGVDGIWLALGLGVVLTALGVVLTEPLVAAFGVSAEIGGHAETFLRIAFLGTAPLLVMLAATGVLRGLQDTRTPLVVAIAGNALNVVANLVLVYGVGSFAGLGLAGSAWGSLLAQTASATALCVVVVRGARRHEARLRPSALGVRRAGRAGVPLLVRTLTLRAALLVTVVAVTLGAGDGDAGADRIATHQVAMTLWTFLAFVLDAVAIAAQALTGRALGAGDVEGTRRLTRRMVSWGLWSGVALGLLLALASPLLGRLFTDDPDVPGLLVPVLLVAALGQPVAGVVFVLDGVLIGAGDGRYLAWAGLVVAVVYAPITLAAVAWGGGLVVVWVLFAGLFMTGRLVTLLHRARGDAWLRTGAGTVAP
ncbi:MATE family efflux transporter [Nocardioides marinquilinus]|uniref:MATE family efflux transporter n=1 Tax=Nocardioides marinquilinus TaxID=1210400 RepID=A0ABP9Q2X3_9ACTN